MKLTSDQARGILEAPAHKSEIESVKRQESQLRVFTEEMDSTELEREVYWHSFKETIKTRSAKKYARVFEFARYPLPVVQLCDSVLSDFFKVFDGKNRHFHVDGDRDLTALRRWIDQISLDKWIQTKAIQVFKNKPCSFVVVDRDSAGVPYLVYIDVERLIDAQFKNAKGDLDYIAFIHSKGTEEGGREFTKYSVYDDENFFVFFRYNDEGIYTLESTVKHSIGYCPGRAFISEPTNGKNYFKRRVAFSGALSKLEDWTAFDIYRNYVDHYAPFPVTEAPARKCVNPDCVNGQIKKEVLDPADPEKISFTYHNCKQCKDRQDDMVLPGTHIGINVRTMKDENDGSGVFRMIFPDTDKMKYVPEKLDDLEVEVRHKTVGLNYMDSTNEAMNEMQLKGSFASMESVLLRTKEELDIIYKWIVTTVGHLFYKDLAIKVDANFGTEFYLISEEDLQIRFDNAKKMGLPQDEMMMIYQQLIDTKYKGNPNKQLRQKMLIELQPYPMDTVSEVIKMNELSLVDPVALSMKINFLSFVTRFEIENGPMTQFGIRMEYDKRLLKIKEVLQIYNLEEMAKVPKPEPEPELKV